MLIVELSIGMFLIPLVLSAIAIIVGILKIFLECKEFSIFSFIFCMLMLCGLFVFVFSMAIGCVNFLMLF